MIHITINKIKNLINEFYETFNIYKALFIVSEDNIDNIYNYLIENDFSVSIIKNYIGNLKELNNFFLHKNRILLISEECTNIYLLINNYLNEIIESLEPSFNIFECYDNMSNYHNILKLLKDINFIIYINNPMITDIDYYKPFGIKDWNDTNKIIIKI